MPNKNRKCRLCKEYAPVDSGVVVPLGFFCSREHALEHQQEKAMESVAKARKAAERKATREHKEEQKAARAQHRARKEALKTAGDYIKEAQTAVNKFIRARDTYKPCVSCGSMPQQKLGGTMDAGHYRSRGAAGHLRFNVFNIAAQCVKCNRYKSGNAVDFRIELIRRIGLDRVERLENDNTPRRFDIEYLKRVKKIFNKRARLYKTIRRKKALPK